MLRSIGLPLKILFCNFKRKRFFISRVPPLLYFYFINFYVFDILLRIPFTFYYLSFYYNVNTRH